RAHVAEALHHRSRVVGPEVQLVEGFENAVDDAPAGGLAPADTAAQLDRLARDDLGAGVADVHAVGVVDPGHGLLVGAQVGGHHLHARPDDDQHLLGETAGDAFQLAGGQLGRVAGDAALGAAERQVHDAALP